jgi:hypothetical protein
MMWHVLMIVIVGGCSYAAWWQWHRAAGGNTLSYLYSVEWPAFAIVAIVGWWQLVTEPPEELEARREERRLAALPKPVAYDTEVLRRELAAHPELVKAFPEVVKAFPELGLPELGLPALGSSGTGELATGSPVGPWGASSTVPAVSGAAVPAVSAIDDEEVVAAPSEEARAYNAMLGGLAATGKPKTWRNPRGR